MTESPVLGRVREQFADLGQSSVRNDNFLGVVSYVSSECLKSTHRFVTLNLICTSFVYTVTDVDGNPPVKSPPHTGARHAPNPDSGVCKDMI